MWKHRAKFIVFISVLLVLALIIGACSKETPETTIQTQTQTQTVTETPFKPITLVLASIQPPGTFYPTKMEQTLYDRMEEATGGRVVVEPHWGGELCTMIETYDAVVKGVADMGFAITTELQTRFPLNQIIPFASYDIEQHKASLVLWELMEKVPEMKAQYHETKLCNLWGMNKGYLGSSKPMSTLESCQGLKMNGPGKWIAERMSAMGMVPIAVAPLEMFPAIEKGVLDGTGFIGCMLRDYQMGPLLKYAIDISCSLVDMSLVMNLDTWNKLPADIQGILDDVFWEHQNKVDDFYTQMDRDTMTGPGSAVEEFGIEVTFLSAEERAKFAAVDEPVRERFVEWLEDQGLPGTKLMEEFNKLQEKYAGPEYELK